MKNSWPIHVFHIHHVFVIYATGKGKILLNLQDWNNLLENLKGYFKFIQGQTGKLSWISRNLSLANENIYNI